MRQELRAGAVRERDVHKTTGPSQFNSAPGPTGPSPILRTVPRPTAARQGGKGALPAPPQAAKSHLMRTRLFICRKKRRFATEADAITAAQAASIPLRPYLCDRCLGYHLTSRTKGKRRLPVAG